MQLCSVRWSTLRVVPRPQWSALGLHSCSWSLPESNGLDLKPDSWADPPGCKHRWRIFHRPGLRGRRYSVGGNAGDPRGRTVGIAGRSSTFRPPDKRPPKQRFSRSGNLACPSRLSRWQQRTSTWWTSLFTSGLWSRMMEEVRLRYCDV